MRPAFDPIDHVLALDLGARGVARFFTPGGAVAAGRALHGARRVLIATGFTVAADTPETDGPPGAAILGRALRQLGARVRYVTDPINVPVLEAALKVVDQPADIIVYPDGDGAAPAILAAERPTHLVAVERPGRTASGHYLNLRGLPIDDWNRRVDELFLAIPDPRQSDRAQRPRGRAGSVAHGLGRLRQAASRSHSEPRPVTIGVGDGGNEIGMGNVRRRLARGDGLMSRIASIVRVDHLVVAGTSNWGAYGIVAALEALAERDLLHTPDVERRLVEACVAAGASDGITRQREATVDGLPLDVHGAVISLLRAVPRGRGRSARR